MAIHWRSVGLGTVITTVLMCLICVVTVYIYTGVSMIAAAHSCREDYERHERMVTLRNSGEYNEAVAMINARFYNHREISQNYYFRSTIYIRQGDTAKGLVDLELANKLYKDHFAAHSFRPIDYDDNLGYDIDIARVYEESGQKEEASRLYLLVYNKMLKDRKITNYMNILDHFVAGRREIDKECGFPELQYHRGTSLEQNVARRTACHEWLREFIVIDDAIVRNISDPHAEVRELDNKVSDDTQ